MAPGAGEREREKGRGKTLIESVDKSKKQISLPSILRDPVNFTYDPHTYVRTY